MNRLRHPNGRICIPILVTFVALWPKCLAEPLKGKKNYFHSPFQKVQSLPLGQLIDSVAGMRQDIMAVGVCSGKGSYSPHGGQEVEKCRIQAGARPK
jgi:hypothetical protein